MRKRIFLVVCIATTASLTARADGVAPVAVEAPAFNWSGYYFGAHLGMGLNRTDISDPYGPSIYGDNVRAPNAMIGLQGGYNWQAPASAWVFGAEADLSWLGGDGSDTCFAYSGEYISSNCTTHPDVAGSLAGRVGYATGASGRTLLYGKVGGAFVHNDLTAYTNHTFDGLPYDTSDNSSTRWGWMLGAAWSRPYRQHGR